MTRYFHSVRFSRSLHLFGRLIRNYNGFITLWESKKENIFSQQIEFYICSNVLLDDTYFHIIHNMCTRPRSFYAFEIGLYDSS